MSAALEGSEGSFSSGAKPAKPGSLKGGEYLQRIFKLADRLKEASKVADGEPCADLQVKLQKMEQRFSAAQEISQRKFQTVKEQLLRVQRDLDEETSSLTWLGEVKPAKLDQLESTLHAGLTAEQEARREAETRLLALLDAKTSALKDELARSGRLQLESEVSLRRYLEVDIPLLHQGLKEEVVNREAMEERMVRRAMDEVTQLQTAIQRERKAREDAEEAMIRMMEEVVARTKAELAKEREERQRTEELLLKMLSECCQKLQLAATAGP